MRRVPQTPNEVPKGPRLDIAGLNEAIYDLPAYLSIFKYLGCCNISILRCDHSLDFE